MRTLRILALLSLAASGFAGDASRLPRSAPEEQGVPAAAILGFIDAAEQRVDALHSFMIVRHGRVVAEGWWAPYAAQEQHVLFSLSKSFTSTAIGLAISEGKLSLDDPILKFFPDEAPAIPSANLKAMRVRDLLRMSAGQRAEDIKNFPYDSKEDLVKAFLELPVPDIPGTHFVYNTPGSYVLSAIVQKVTGQTELDYLGPRIFAPLGIADPRWDTSAQGISFGGFGLHLRTEDVAKFGQLYLQRGQWNGTQLLPASWVDEAGKVQTANGSDPTSDWNQGYGYLFWRCRPGFYRADGAYGQFCFVMPQYDTVVAVTSGTKDMQSVMNAVYEKILPGLGASALPADPDADRRLAQRLAGLSLKPQVGEASSPTGARIAGKLYVIPANPSGIEAVALEPAKDGADARVTFRISGSDQVFACGFGKWVKGTLATTGHDQTAAIAASGAWTSGDTYSLKIYRYQTPFCTSFDLRFAGDKLVLEWLNNVEANSDAPGRVYGTLQP